MTACRCGALPGEECAYTSGCVAPNVSPAEAFWSTLGLGAFVLCMLGFLGGVVETSRIEAAREVLSMEPVVVEVPRACNAREWLTQGI